MSALKMSGRNVKVLMLHGYTNNGPVFHRKTGSLRKALQKKMTCDFVFPTAPIKLETPSVAKADDEGNTNDTQDAHGWWRADDSKRDFVGWDDSVAFIQNIFDEQGPFDGIIGFSQGAAFAGMIGSLIEKKKMNHPKLTFIIAFSGFRARFEKYDYLYEPPIRTPVMNVIGSLDTVVEEERTMKLVEVCENGSVVRHMGGHFVPSSAGPREQVVSWVQTQLEREEAPKL